MQSVSYNLECSMQIGFRVPEGVLVHYVPARPWVGWGGVSGSHLCPKEGESLLCRGMLAAEFALCGGPPGSLGRYAFLGGV